MDSDSILTRHPKEPLRSSIAYFASYWFACPASEFATGYGNTVVWLEDRIGHIDQVREIEAFILATMVAKGYPADGTVVTLANWQRLADMDKDEGEPESTQCKLTEQPLTSKLKRVK